MKLTDEINYTNNCRRTGEPNEDDIQEEGFVTTVKHSPEGIENFEISNRGEIQE